MRRLKIVIAVVLAAVSVVHGGRCPAGETNAPAFAPKLPDESRYFQGRFVYERQCVVCHGPTGNGAGPMAGPLIPKPRSFRSGIFKYSSTPPGFLPTDADLRRTIRQGVPNTSMPIFDKLTGPDVDALVEYIKFFSPRWRHPENYSPPMQPPEPPEWFYAAAELRRRAAVGKNLFLAACAACHGSDGDGRGPAAASLVDDWGEPLRPADLRRPPLRCGPDPRDVYRVLLNGVAGTPMPAFGETTTEEQRWELVAFIGQLGSPERNPTTAR